MDLRKCLLTKNNCYKTGKKITPIGVMWHSTGANNPNLKRYVQPDDGKLGVNPNANDWNRATPGGREVCVHAFIGKDKNGDVCTYQTLPWNYRGWHCGGAGNDRYISFEMCEDDLKDRSYFNAVYKEAVEFTAYLCKLYGFNPKGKNVIICHQDGYKLGIASNHSDVYHWFNKYGKTMDDVRNDVAKAMGESGEISTSKPATSKPSTSSAEIKVDGWWGVDTTKLLQKIFKTPVDGIVSNQDPAQKKYLLRADSKAWDFKGQGNGSDLIGAMQKKVGVKDDGFMGPKTIKAWQKYLGVSVDGKMGEKTVKALQKWANKQV